MDFTKNERKVLGLLLDNGRVTDIAMASQLKISTQAVGKIRKKLEDTGVIEGYSCSLNFEKLGLQSFSLEVIRLKQAFWQDFGETDSLKALKMHPESILSFVPSNGEASFVRLQAFRDAAERDRYTHLNRARNHEYLDMIASYSFSHFNLLKNTARDVLKLALGGKPIVPQRHAELQRQLSSNNSKSLLKYSSEKKI